MHIFKCTTLENEELVNVCVLVNTLCMDDVILLFEEKKCSLPFEICETTKLALPWANNEEDCLQRRLLQLEAAREIQLCVV